MSWGEKRNEICSRLIVEPPRLFSSSIPPSPVAATWSGAQEVMASDVIRIARFSWLAMVLMPLVVSAFFAPPKVTHRIRPSSIRILSISNEAENQPSDADDKVDTNIDATIQSKKYTMARAGGRRPRFDQKSRSNQLDVVKERIFSLIGDFGLPFLIMTVALRLIFGGGSTDNPNVVYYSRSVYQSSLYTKDGKVETTRKENFQSNVPELVKQAKVKGSKQQLKGGAEEKDFFNIIDDNLEDGIDLIFGKW